MLTPEDEAAREGLRTRQGIGARCDVPSAPHEDLLLARRGTTYFAWKLNELSDIEIYGPSLGPYWTRAYVVAQICYEARTGLSCRQPLSTNTRPVATPVSSAVSHSTFH